MSGALSVLIATYLLTLPRRGACEGFMTSFILRKIDPDFWARVRAKAEAEGTTVRAVILRLLAAWLVACALVSVTACGGDSPAAPTPPPTPPAPVTFTLSGTVTSTTGAAIAGATVRITDGPNAGRSATTSAGSYSITGLSLSGFTAVASATNFQPVSQGVTLTSNQTVDFQLAPTPLFTISGTGNTVFDMPTSVARVRIQGRWLNRDNSNFIVTIGGRLIVNEILRTTITYDAIHLTGGGGVTAITNSSAIAWTFTEVR
jgi:hypothetical protein